MFGSPSEAIEPIKTLVLDLPSGVSYVTDPASSKSALYLIGPLVPNVPIEDQAQILPASRSWVAGGPIVYFHFEAPIPPGSYQVVVHQSRIKDMDGNAMSLQDELGNDWVGWPLTVLANPRALADLTSVADPIVLDPSLNPPISTIGTDSYTVYLDGEVVPPGTPGLSGEVLSVVATDEANITMEIEYLTPGAYESLYELYLHRFSSKDGSYITHFAAAGPVLDYKWAKYNGVKTDGRILVDTDGKIIVADAVVHAAGNPNTVPTLTYNVSDADVPEIGHPNTYDVVTYSVVPSKVNPLLDSYESIKFVFPDTVADATNTPATNSRLYSGALYLPETATVSPTDDAAAFDLPLASRIRIYADGVEVWWGQTRFVPLMITPRRYHALQSTRSHSPSEDADLQYLIWRASLEVLAFWNCSIPTNSNNQPYIPATFEEYIITRLAYGWSHEDGSHGNLTVKMGDHLYSGTPDRALQRRLQALAHMLEACLTSMPLFPEDDVYMGVARIGSDASPKMWAEPSMRPNFWPSASGKNKLLRVSDLNDPFLHARRYIENAS